jgi:hypothetical protein
MIQDILQGTDIVEFIKWLRLRWYGHIDRLNNERMQKQSGMEWKEQGKEEVHGKMDR